jgi:hypothetical protein
MANQPYSATQKLSFAYTSFQNRNVLWGMQGMGCQARRRQDLGQFQVTL